jgi:phosphatidate phosphatase APP1
LKAALLKWIWKVETQADRVIRDVRGRFDPIRAVRIQAFRGFGNQNQVELCARIIEDRDIRPPRERSSHWQNIRATAKHFATREIPGVTLRAEVSGQSQEQVSDEEGYVHFRFETGHFAAAHRPWQSAHLGTLAPVARSAAISYAETEILIPPASARFGVISDIDDTVIRTGATSVFSKTRVTLLRNAHSRSPFAGIAAFYQALQRGTAAHEFNPVFYLTSSPWNLYDLFSQFIEIHGLPKGPLLMKDLGIERTHLFKSSHSAFKYGHVQRWLQRFPDLRFVLVGDSGQQDPEIYQRVAETFPHQILAIYIRNVSKLRRTGEIRSIASKLNAMGIPMLLVEDTLEAALHAADRGWIHPSAVEAIKEECRRDAAT